MVCTGSTTAHSSQMGGSIHHKYRQMQRYVITYIISDSIFLSLINFLKKYILILDETKQTCILERRDIAHRWLPVGVCALFTHFFLRALLTHDCVAHFLQ